MESERCKHVVEPFCKREDAVNARISKIEVFQRAMPAQKFEMGDDSKKKWHEILKQFDCALKKAEEELLELQKELCK